MKPIEIMRYLVRLVTPPDGIVLDPFAGSGTTGCAAALEGFKFIGIERDPAYAEIAKARIAHWAKGALDKSVSKTVNRSPLTGGDAQKTKTETTDENTTTTATTTTTDQEGDEMANLPMDMAMEVGKATTTGGGNYIQHGDYTYMVDKWFYQKLQDRCIITEFFVIEATKKVVYENGRPVEQEPNAVGSKCSETINFDGPSKQSAPGNARAVVLGLFGFKEGQVPESTVTQTLTDVCDDQKQPARGMLIRLSTFPKEKRSKPGEFITGRNWECVSKPGEGLNALDLVQARIKAYSISPDECLRVTREQIAKFKGGQLPATTTATAPAPGIAATVNPPPPVVMTPPPVTDPLVGWTANPNDPSGTWFYRQGPTGLEQKTKADILAGR